MLKKHIKEIVSKHQTKYKKQEDRNDGGKTMSRVAVIGGGAAGMMAAIASAEVGHEVSLYEKNEKLGKKLFITGKGRCNVTNACATEELFDHVVTNPKFLYSSFYGLTNYDVMDKVEQWGCPLKTERGERVFPVSDKSSDVIRAFSSRLREVGVDVHLYSEVEGIETKDDRVSGIRLRKEKKTIPADAVIVATGGMSYQTTGSTGDGYEFAKKVGHKVTELSPSLVQIKTETDVVKKLKGIKLNANVSLGNFKEYGEVLFTEYGLSGPAVFSLSSRLKNQKTISLDIMSEYSEDELYNMISVRMYQNPKITLENFFVGIFNKRVGQALLKYCGIEPLSRYAVTLGEKEIRRICSTIKKWDFKITGTMSWNNAQVTKGGVITDDFNPNTMESKLVSGLYATGEVLDIDGDCGGYNLQWAWSSGYLAGISVGE